METREKNKKLLIVVGVLLLFGGVSLAYYVSSILINGSGAKTKITTANINGATINIEGVLSFEDLDIYPGHKSVSGIKVTATGNNELVPYNLVWNGTNTLTTPLNFTIYKTSEEVSVRATCEKKNRVVGASTELSEECTISNIDKLGTEVSTGTINKNETKVNLVKDEFITAVTNGISYYYYVILEYPNLDEPQNADLEGSIDGEVTVEASNIQPDINIIAAYVIQEDGTYKETDDIPQSGYTINTSKSTCSNGAIPSWDHNKNGLLTTNLTKSGTNCYLYFDKYIPPITMDNIIAGLNAKTTTPDFASAATTDEGVYRVSDGMYGGYSYYWRGAVTNNYVMFASKCWRIVRINGDKTMRLIYDGTTCHANGTKTADSIAVTSQKYNPSYDRSEYVGWTYTTGTQRTTSGTASNAKSQTESWYSSNITETNANKVADGKYCNDRNTASGYSWSSQPSSTFYYAGYDRSGANPRLSVTPTLICSSGDIYTIKAGAITMDEVVMAGAKYATGNSNYYLYNGQHYWTMSPHHWDGTYAHVFFVQPNGYLDGSNVNAARPLRPVINLRSDVTFKSGGTGTLENPYVVQ